MLTALPRSRPHRRSNKRPATSGAKTDAPAAATGVLERPEAPAAPLTGPTRSASRRPKGAGTGRPERLRQPPQPRGLPPKPETAAPERRDPPLSTGTDILTTAVQAAGELAEIGVTLSARMLRRAVSRLPRP